MIRYILIAVAISACSMSTTKDHQHGPKDDHTESATVGRKAGRWQLDQATRQNMTDLRGILTGPASEKNISQVTTSLEAKTDELVRECTMKGPDHDALHLWLEGYLGHLKELKRTSSPVFYDSLQHDIAVFDKQFE